MIKTIPVKLNIKPLPNVTHVYLVFNLDISEFNKLTPFFEECFEKHDQVIIQPVYNRSVESVEDFRRFIEVYGSTEMGMHVHQPYWCQSPCAEVLDIMKKVLQNLLQDVNGNTDLYKGVFDVPALEITVLGDYND